MTLVDLLLFLATNPWFVNLILAHKLGTALFAYSIFSALVDGMPKPEENAGRGYRWLYGSLHALALNLFTAAAAFFPRIAQLLGRAPAAPALEESPAPNPPRGRLLTMPAPRPSTPPEDPSKPA